MINFVIVPTIVRDRFADEIIRWAKRSGLLSLAIQVNLDAFNIKSSIEAADYQGLWGEQSWYFYRLGCRQPSKRIVYLGTPRYDKFIPIPKDQARKSLKIDHKGKLILFAGATSAFEEIKTLKLIESQIENGILDREIKLIYKPHPNGQADQAQGDFHPDEYKNVSLFVEDEKKTWTDLNVYPELLSAVDGVITPYSTMAVEACIIGRPVLLLGYHDGQFTPYWKYARSFFHVHFFYKKRFAIQCHNGDEFNKCLSSFTKLLGDKNIEIESNIYSQFIVYRNDDSFAQKLVETILELKHQ